MQCFQEITYVVREGDTLFRLAELYQTTVSALTAMNPGIDPYNLSIGSVIRICPGEGAFEAPAEDVNCDKRVALFTAMRRAWAQHVFWTRLFLVSAAENLADLPFVTDRLMQNPKDIADVFANFYSAENADRIEQLLTEHLRIGGDLIKAMRDGKNEESERLTNDWYINAGEIADFLVIINPFLNPGDTHEMLFTHLDLLSEQIAARLKKNHTEEIAAADKGERQAMSMADRFSSAIMEQFPQLF